VCSVRVLGGASQGGSGDKTRQVSCFFPSGPRPFAMYNSIIARIVIRCWGFHISFFRDSPLSLSLSAPFPARRVLSPATIPSSSHTEGRPFADRSDFFLFTVVSSPRTLPQARKETKRTSKKSNDASLELHIQASDADMVEDSYTDIRCRI
jgi:hypothetical protein